MKISVCIFLVLLTSCAASREEQQLENAARSHVYRRPRAAVLAALRAILVEKGYSIERFDVAAGIVATGWRIRGDRQDRVVASELAEGAGVRVQATRERQETGSDSPAIPSAPEEASDVERTLFERLEPGESAGLRQLGVSGTAP